MIKEPRIQIEEKLTNILDIKENWPGGGSFTRLEGQGAPVKTGTIAI
jgi:hypothetical protein